MLEKSGFVNENVIYLTTQQLRSCEVSRISPVFNITVQWTKPTSTVTINHNFIAFKWNSEH